MSIGKDDGQFFIGSALDSFRENIPNLLILSVTLARLLQQKWDINPNQGMKGGVNPYQVLTFLGQSANYRIPGQTVGYC